MKTRFTTWATFATAAAAAAVEVVRQPRPAAAIAVADDYAESSPSSSSSSMLPMYQVSSPVPWYVPSAHMALLDVSSDYPLEHFDQLIDHANPEAGTFKQRYWWNADYWAGPGSPIILTTPGESNAASSLGYLANTTIIAQLAMALGAGMVMMEHRFYGESSPHAHLTAKTLQAYTLENSIQDFVHFARTVNLPFVGEAASTATDVPWHYSGFSYAGALAQWIDRLAPGTFWTLHGSSGPVEAIRDFWGYFAAIQDGMPSNCSAAFTRMSTHIDAVLTGGDDREVSRLKAMFNAEELDHNDDFAAAITLWPLSEWQSISHAMPTGYHKFYRMCDAIMLKDPSDPADKQTDMVKGPDLATALKRYSKWYREDYLFNACTKWGYNDWKEPGNVHCFNTHNATAPMYTDTTPNNKMWRTWWWMCCNEPFFWWQTGHRDSRVSIGPMTVTPDMFQAQCDLFFPETEGFTYGAAKGRTQDDVNARTGGWSHVNTTRLVTTNGELDPWRAASAASLFRPGGPVPSTPDAPQILIKGARHCYDLSGANARANADVRSAREMVVSIIKRWVADYRSPTEVLLSRAKDTLRKSL